MSLQLIIGNKNYSSWSLRAWLLLSVYKIEFEEVRIPLFQGNYKDQIAQYCSAGMVPILMDNANVVWDSLSICEYVNEKYCQHKAWPEDLLARAEARSVSSEMHSGFFAIRNQLPMNCRAEKNLKFDSDVLAEISRIDMLWQTLRTKYDQRGPYLFGEFSIADCMFAPMVSRFKTYQVEVSAVSAAYMRTVLQKQEMLDWYADAIKEKEIISISEVGEEVSS